MSFLFDDQFRTDPLFIQNSAEIEVDGVTMASIMAFDYQPRPNRLLQWNFTGTRGSSNTSRRPRRIFFEQNMLSAAAPFATSTQSSKSITINYRRQNAPRQIGSIRKTCGKIMQMRCVSGKMDFYQTIFSAKQFIAQFNKSSHRMHCNININIMQMHTCEGK